MTSNSPVPWSSYVAIGDSLSEGLWDVPPGTEPNEDPPVRGWADRLAEHLSARRIAAGQSPLLYANLAIRGKLLEPILAEQLPRALAMKPDLVSIIGGGNDALRPSMNPDRLAQLLEGAVSQLREAGIDVLIGTSSDVRGSPVMSAIRPRVGIYTAHIHSLARHVGAYVLDVWGHRGLYDWRLWTEDRIHLSPEGHRRLAEAALVALGLPPSDPEWETPLPAPKTMTRREQFAWNRQWVHDWAGPWLVRRLRGESSGTGRSAKVPDWIEVVPGPDIVLP